MVGSMVLLPPLLGLEPHISSQRNGTRLGLSIFQNVSISSGHRGEKKQKVTKCTFFFPLPSAMNRDPVLRRELVLSPETKGTGKTYG